MKPFTVDLLNQPVIENSKADINGNIGHTLWWEFDTTNSLNKFI